MVIIYLKVWVLITHEQRNPHLTQRKNGLNTTLLMDYDAWQEHSLQKLGEFDKDTLEALLSHVTDDKTE